MKTYSVLLASAIVLTAAVSAMAVGPQMVADFNMPPPNNLGGGYGAFSPKAEEMTYVTTETWDEVDKVGKDGGSMRLEYNVDKPGSFNGFWMKLGPEESGNNFDASAFSKLTFSVKGDTKVGVPAKVKIELKGDPGTRIGRYYIKDIKDSWQKIEVPLKDIAAQKVDLTKLNEFVIVFEQAQAAPGVKGVIWVDEIGFEP